MKKRLRRIINNIRILEHATCTAGGGVIGLEDDVPKALAELEMEDFLDAELALLRELSDQISAAAADLHAKMSEIAEDHNVNLPTTRLVNTGGGGKGP